ncbi:MAG: hypothetical protein IKP40_01210 [Clostridia bacterium]|nr:hypothetical protein [Clostridia bacterium]
MKRLMLVCAMILCFALPFCCFSANAERNPPTQLPAPTVAGFEGDNVSTDRYPFPAQVEGYTFVSFAGDQSCWDLSADELIARIVCQHFEEIYPGCRLEQLRDFVYVPDNQRVTNLNFSHAAASDTNYYFMTRSFAHPLVSNASFTVLLSYGYCCAFFTNAPLMAEELNALENSPFSYRDALALAQQIYTAHFIENELLEPSVEELASLRVRGSYVFNHNEDVRLWQFGFFKPQSPYEHEIDWASGVFEIQIDADTGEVMFQEWIPVTAYDRFLELIGQ